MSEECMTLTVAELAQVLGISRGTAYALTNHPNFTCVVRVGNRKLIPKEAFRRWLNEQT